MRPTNSDESLYSHSHCHERGTTEGNCGHRIKTVDIENGQYPRHYEEIIDAGENGSCMNRDIKDDVAETKEIYAKEYLSGFIQKINSSENSQ